jgi:hypothetical protein
MENIEFCFIFFVEFPFHDSIILSNKQLNILEQRQQEKIKKLEIIQQKKLQDKMNQHEILIQKKQYQKQIEYEQHVARQIKRERQHQRIRRRTIWNEEQKKNQISSY